MRHSEVFTYPEDALNWIADLSRENTITAISVTRVAKRRWFWWFWVSVTYNVVIMTAPSRQPRVEFVFGPVEEQPEAATSGHKR